MHSPSYLPIELHAESLLKKQHFRTCYWLMIHNTYAGDEILCRCTARRLGIVKVTKVNSNCRAGEPDLKLKDRKRNTDRIRIRGMEDAEICIPSNQLLSEKNFHSLNSTYNFCALKNLQFRFQEKNLNLNQDSDRKSVV